MKRSAVLLGVVVIGALGFALGSHAARSDVSAITGTWDFRGTRVQVSGATGTVTTAGRFSDISINTEPLCRHQVGEQVWAGLSGSGSSYTGTFRLLQFQVGGTSDNCTLYDMRAASFILSGGVLHVCVAAKGSTPQASDASCISMTRIGAAPTTSTTTARTNIKTFLFLVSARADAVHMSGIPGTTFYSTSDVAGSGTVTVDLEKQNQLDESPIEKDAGHITVTHVYISDKLPDIVLTLKPQAGGYYKSLNNDTTIDVPVVVTASKGATCKGSTGTLILRENSTIKGIVSLEICHSSFILVDGQGPKGKDPTNDVAVKIS